MLTIWDDIDKALLFQLQVKGTAAKITRTPKMKNCGQSSLLRPLGWRLPRWRTCYHAHQPAEVLAGLTPQAHEGAPGLHSPASVRLRWQPYLSQAPQVTRSSYQSYIIPFVFFSIHLSRFLHWHKPSMNWLLLLNLFLVSLQEVEWREITSTLEPIPLSSYTIHNS